MKKILSGLWYSIRSMRIQVFGIMLCVGLIPVVFLYNIIIDAYNTQLISRREDELKTYGTVISNLVLNTGYLLAKDSVEVENETNEIAAVYQGRIMILDRDLCVLKDTYGMAEGKTVISTEAIKCFTGSDKIYTNSLGEYMQLTMPIIDTSDNTVCGAILITTSMKSIYQISHAVTYRVIFLLVGVAGFIFIVSLFYSYFLAKPLKKITESIDEISAGDMSIKLETRGYSELSTIADSFNQMLSVIQKQDSQRQAFVSDVSHELKTPLASMKVLSDSLLSQEEVPAELYREFLVDITEEIERMTKIINDLLSMVKMDKSTANVQVENISINDLIENLLKRLRPIAAERKIELIYESFRPVMADVDEVKISIAFNNLIENAIKYNYDEGWVRVTLNADHKFFYVTVLDSGVGIPEDVQDNVFERFYRVDKARSRDTGGTGLGLSLTRSAVLLHRGSIKLYSKENEGTTFTVRIPLNYIP